MIKVIIQISTPIIDIIVHTDLQCSIGYTLSGRVNRVISPINIMSQIGIQNKINQNN